MQTLALYLVTAVIFLGLDAAMLKFVMRPLFEKNLGDMVLSDPRLGPAAIFYLFYVGGLLWFVSVPALGAGAPSQAFVNGAILGALAYGTYEFTNFATLRGWAPQMVATDLIWGAFLTGISAFLGVLVVTRLFPSAS
ncbi:DUF2177 family protein [Pseudooceanicola sediminis]|uniref:DUF2177 family protein n=1 Tax=Pseudooceanicola sediminis TaxID=2211117 RepID=A0A399J402_9RHOB|nr:DUF2177 family protein [Pseudooceanicola sediminis]KAA2314149.1 DUF2177 family protein [Puniceibacterium sp. HSS470]RII39991.1 DUF2177 family protein [Pseudooceanicola sediminis]|tara:strand:+ start:51896 stop:52306 length:411 start_codon:yes stop_codon:yes gene_type:complete